MKNKPITENWSKALALPVGFLVLGVLAMYPIEKYKMGSWLLVWSLFLFWVARKNINKKTITEAVVYCGGGLLLAGVVTYFAPWAGLYGPNEKEDAYLALFLGSFLSVAGFILRFYVIKYRPNKALQTTSASARRLS